MKLFSCPSCNQVVFFENVVCEKCGHSLGYAANSDEMISLDPDHGIWKAAGTNGAGKSWKYCDNYQYGVCNWLVDGESPNKYCKACAHNVTVPDTSNPENVRLWGQMEIAKRRLFYAIERLGLPLVTRDEHEEGLGFDFLAEDDSVKGNVMTGHDLGLITIALAEADDAERVKRRESMGEPYRTLLGHFRHEVGHWYWDRIVRDGNPGALEACRAVFGDDTEDYGEALKRHYENGPKPNWQDEYVSSYAGAHAWEDFAETWAHYLHIVDTLEVGHSFGVVVDPRVADQGLLTTRIDFDPYARETSIEQLTDAWFPLSASLNSFNRAMGHNDLYPFVLSPAVVAKLGFMHDLVRRRAGQAG
ncbi:putative zinc-binding peptidase [Fulvimarina sp. 2208YS6-2-32]|uniref:Zinc-binding peptidase n=1 Tax=Fulvimarina uroteuthidis TaxID=3098149 RepID=A0ABU5I991_9HYPH|nr:putative zinc-binding peptidase [Fulvimarina sp. 2208YS6-2-32]MDY8110841.1 putative zinc-binding peptidase [Fulvimarina sp. 2208YS6-2-32]